MRCNYSLHNQSVILSVTVIVTMTNPAIGIILKGHAVMQHMQYDQQRESKCTPFYLNYIQSFICKAIMWKNKFTTTILLLEIPYFLNYRLIFFQYFTKWAMLIIIVLNNFNKRFVNKLYYPQNITIVLVINACVYKIKATHILSLTSPKI